ncbi:hypothetical protein CPB84DRAFT_1790376 [Gymnopilus junonius]|uniref:Uncharacterized protein n=1 Tax=Gymnopilus junonius TaxID=109634 RepID=A0A9P5NE42_GYMJU|nr:hypothetical protein CPB84DRAFT_1790376 [Gymnopilus junonius]
MLYSSILLTYYYSTSTLCCVHRHSHILRYLAIFLHCTAKVIATLSTAWIIAMSS